VIVCVCRRISDRDIARAAHDGMSFDDVQMELGVATQCGSCESDARQCHAQHCCSGAVALIRRVDDAKHTERLLLATA
jgi:bacterioferritin-associated ferredoxin